MGLPEYHYRFAMAKVNQEIINSLPNYKPGLKAFLVEVRTKFTLKTKPPVQEGVTAAEVYIDWDAFRGFTYAHGDIKSEVAMLYRTTSSRLAEYRMTRNEIIAFAHSVVVFARGMAARPEHAGLDLIPVVVEMEVCTVQQAEETFEEAMGVAMRADKLVPRRLVPYEPRPSLDQFGSTI